MNFEEFIKPELLVLIPVLYFVGNAIKKSAAKDALIPFILGVISIVLCGLYVIATSEIYGLQAVATAIFTAVTQGILIAGASVYTDQLIKQSKKED